jgi:tRNA-specific 2-thiouridylase
MSDNAAEIVQCVLSDLAPLKGVRVIAAMSGGVDSSVTATLLRQAGLDVVGVFLNVWDYSRDEASGHGSCCSLEDSYDARRVADHIGIPFYAMDMRQSFRRDVIDPFIRDYETGRTPNPCERCNRFIKFGALLDAADQLEAQFVATGHYVQRRDGSDGIHIFKGNDAGKDQSYFLATTGREQIKRILFPVGGLKKGDTRKLARFFNVPTAEKGESQDICFIPAGDRIAFLKRQGATAGLQSGDIVDAGGNVLGQHAGIAHFTMGQRKGLGLPDGPWHVIGLDGETARVVVAHPEDALIQAAVVSDMTWIRHLQAGETITARVRYQMQPVACHVQFDGERVRLLFDELQKPTAPGQVAALYAGDELLGGGIISKIIR